ncbi:glucose-1-phosphate adenylyltransferase [Candidatus Azambacteria bacterium]|nr:glucose-1-phosphate adenylyltransferase [Candidatus Azambacteria bacterium]
MRNVMAVVLAGGQGSRLMPLTLNRAKPAVPFGGKYVIFDFVMSSIINSDVRKTIILTQYGSQPLIDHIDKFGFSNPFYGSSVRVVPAQMRISKDWYKGTADAVFQNLEFISREKEISQVAILAGDHIYNIDLKQMKDFHDGMKSDFTVCALVVPSNEAAGNFGVIQVDDKHKIIGFEEKPEKPKEIPGRPGYCFVSMGNYIVHLDYLTKLLHEDSLNDLSEHDFGKNIIPKIVKSKGNLFAFDFSTNNHSSYWRDVGRIGQYHAANMDLASNKPILNLYNENWPIRTFPDYLPLAKKTRDYRHVDDPVAPFKNQCKDQNVMLSGGCILDAPLVLEMSIFGRNARVDFGASVIESVIFSGVKIGAHAKIVRSIIDEGIIIPEGILIGVNHDEDKERGFEVIDGITVVPKGYVFK